VARRRPSFATYARRRWRVVGLLVVLLAGSLLILAITDRGHDPTWQVRGADTEQAALSPSGDAVYALVRGHGNITALDARRGSDGHLLWESPLNATRALLVAGDDGVALATDFPQAFLTFYAKDGAVRYQVPLAGVPRAMAVEGPRVALALTAPDNPVVVYDNGTQAMVHRFPDFVNALDMRGGRLAAGTGAGSVRIEGALNGTLLYNGSFSISVRSLRLAGDGGSMVLGGASLLQGDLTGMVAFVDLLSDQPVRWSKQTTSGVGYVDLDRAGLWAIAAETAPPRDVVHAYEAYTGRERWSRVVEGGLAQGDANAGGGVALSADGQTVAVGTLHGGIGAYRMVDGARLWSYRAEGTTLVVFAGANGDALLANGRFAAGGSDSGLFSFSVAREPFAGRLPALALLVAALLIAAAAAILGVGYWRLRRSY